MSDGGPIGTPFGVFVVSVAVKDFHDSRKLPNSYLGPPPRPPGPAGASRVLPEGGVPSAAPLLVLEWPQVLSLGTRGVSGRITAHTCALPRAAQQCSSEAASQPVKFGCCHRCREAGARSVPQCGSPPWIAGMPGIADWISRELLPGVA